MYVAVDKVVCFSEVLFYRDESAPEFIEDANAKKPNDWLEDEPDHIPDPTAVKPDDWCVKRVIVVAFLP